MHKDATSGQNEPRPSAQLGLAEEIHELTAYMKRVNKPHHRFWMGMLGGLGAAIGATILAAPLLYILSKLLIPLGVEISA